MDEVTVTLSDATWRLVIDCLNMGFDMGHELGRVEDADDFGAVAFILDKAYGKGVPA
jgi:hypothetical protein